MYQSISKTFVLLLAVNSILGYSNSFEPVYDNQICVNRQDKEIIAVPNSCTQYYQCDSNIGYFIDCSNYGEYRFDPKLGRCNFADQVECFEPIHSLSGPESVNSLQSQQVDNKVIIHAPEHDSFICRGYQNFVTLGVKGSCSLFYTCLDDVGYLEDCKLSGDFQYDPKFGRCNNRNRVKCDDSEIYVRSPYYY